MKLLEKIVVNVNLDNSFHNSIEIAEQLAMKFNSKIILLCVLPKEAKIDSINNYVKTFAENQLKRITEGLTYPLDKIEKRIEYGNSFEVILSVSEIEDVNLIINQLEEESVNSETKIDILSEKLVRKSLKPVMIVKSDTKSIPEKILCPVDLSDSSKRAMYNALKVARVFKSELTILNVYEPLLESFPNRIEVDFQKENKERKERNRKQLENFINQFNLIDINYSLINLTGRTKDVLKEYASSNSHDLIFMGATGKNYVQRLLLGSVTENLLRSMPSTMIVLKAENLIDLKIESDISTIEKHLDQAIKLEETGYLEEALNQLKTCLLINDLHLPALNRLINLYKKMGNLEQADKYQNIVNEVLRRLWEKNIQFEIRKAYKF
jgi:universal stress protein E